jgi:hypothetical protein
MAIEMLPIKMVPVDADLFDAIGYVSKGRRLYIKFRNSSAFSFEDVPGFRYEGLLAAPRKDAYYRTFIKDRFLTKPVEFPPQT